MTETELLVDKLLQKVSDRKEDQQSLYLARLAFSDYLACLYKGLTTAKNRAFIEDLALKSSAKISFTQLSTSPERAALAQAYLAHYDDFDDVHANFRGHPSAVIFSALLAVSDSQTSLKDLLWAYVQGLELAGRLGLQFQPQHVQAGWHATATIGTVGAAAAIGNLKQLSPDVFSQFLSLASNQASGFLYQEGTDGKPLNAGFAARNAVTAYQLVSSQLTAYADPFSSRKGWAQIMLGESLDISKLLNQWLMPSQISSPGLWFKCYPFCSAAAAGFEASLLAHKSGIVPEQILSLTAHFAPNGDKALSHHSPKTGLEGKFSIEYIVWLGLKQGNVHLHNFSEKAVPEEFKDFLPKVTRKSDLETERSKRPVLLEIKTKNKTQSFLIEDPKGSPDNPLSEQEIISKAHDLSKGHLDELLVQLKNEDMPLSALPLLL
ncbi:MmgE/PrpD family protein [Streptococcus dentiloxodontae]